MPEQLGQLVVSHVGARNTRMGGVMPLIIRAIWAITLMAFLVSVSGCATSRMTPTMEELERPGTGLRSESGQKITGYRLLGESWIEYKGWASLVGQDSISMWHNEKTSEPNEDGLREQTRVDGPRFSLDQVKGLNVYSSNSAGTVGLVVLGGVVLFAVLFATSDYEFESSSK